MVTVETHHLESSTAVGVRASALEEILEAAIQVLAGVMGRLHPLVAKPIPQDHRQCVSLIPFLLAMIIAWWSSWLSYDRLATGQGSLRRLPRSITSNELEVINVAVDARHGIPTEAKLSVHSSRTVILRDPYFPWL